jgi:hypothetical protein
MRGALALAVLVALAVATPAQTAVHAAGDKQRATKRLKDARFTRFTESGESSFDQRLHLCANKRFIYDTVSSAGITTRTTGRWRVVAASIRRNVWKARVRGRIDGGGRVTIRIRTAGGRTTINGDLVIADRSDLC